MDLQNVKNITIPEGNVKTIHDGNGSLLWGKLSYTTKYSGDIIQEGTATPDAPVSVEIVTGTQSINLSDGTNNKVYDIHLGAIELGKMGISQDYIYKSGSDWYIHKSIGKYIFDGTEEFTTGPYGVNSWVSTGLISVNYNTSLTQIMSNLFKGVSNDERNSAGNNIIYTSSNIQFWIRNTSFTTLANLQAALTGNYIYYILATATDTKITDNTLISELNNIEQWITRAGYEYTITGNLPIILDRTNL